MASYMVATSRKRAFGKQQSIWRQKLRSPTGAIIWFVVTSGTISVVRGVLIISVAATVSRSAFFFINYSYGGLARRSWRGAGKQPQYVLAAYMHRQWRLSGDARRGANSISQATTHGVAIQRMAGVNKTRRMAPRYLVGICAHPRIISICCFARGNVYDVSCIVTNRMNVLCRRRSRLRRIAT